MSQSVVYMKDIQKSFPGVHALDNAQIELKAGEVHGLVGENGAGKSTLMKVLTGIYDSDSGTVNVKGKDVSYRTPADALDDGIRMIHQELNLIPHLTVADNIFIGREPKKGIVLDKKKVEEDTKKLFGLAIGLSVADNTVMASMDEFVDGGVVNEPKIAEVTEEYVDKLALKTPSIKQLVRNLSGGNQQKVIIAKWLVRDCDILIFDEPAREIDVGAKSEIYRLMNQLAQEGKSIIMISSEMPELLRMSDRIIVMC